ncbi:MAG: Fic family protein [Thermoleophilia bacterium]
MEFYPDFATKAAVLTVHLVKNHALPDGNKRVSGGGHRGDRRAQTDGVDVRPPDTTAALKWASRKPGQPAPSSEASGTATIVRSITRTS